MQLSDKLRVQKLKRGLCFVLAGFQQAKGAVLFFEFLEISLQLPVDFVAIVQLRLQHCELLLGDRVFSLKLILLELQGFLVLDLGGQIIDADSILSFALGLSLASRGHRFELSEFARDYLVKLDLSALVHAYFLLLATSFGSSQGLVSFKYCLF